MYGRRVLPSSTRVPREEPHPPPPLPLPAQNLSTLPDRLPAPQPPPLTSPGRHPKYKGIRCRGGKWVSEIREPRKARRIWLGTYPAAEMAAVAYDVAALALKGAEAALNFPDMVSRHPVPASTSPSDIQAAAAAAAAALATKSQSSPSESDEQITSPMEADAEEEEATAGEKEGLAVAIPQEGSATTTATTSAYSSQDETMTTATATGAVSDFMDEEEMFNMPKLLESMAEAMLMSPPRMRLAHSDDESPQASDADSLWSYQ